MSPQRRRKRDALILYLFEERISLVMTQQHGNRMEEFTAAYETSLSTLVSDGFVDSGSQVLFALSCFRQACGRGCIDLIPVIDVDLRQRCGVLLDLSPNEIHRGLREAVAHGRLPMATYILQTYHFGPKPPLGLSEETDSILHVAVKRRSLSMVRLLLEHGAPVDGVDHMQNTPLHYACMDGAIEMIQLLMEQRADLNLPNIFGRSPLHEVCLRSRSSAAEAAGLLLEGGADVHFASKNRDTPLQAACRANNLSPVPVLLRYGADPFESGEEMNAFEQAAHFGAIDILELLIRTSRIQRLTDCRSLLHAAADGLQEQVLQWVLSHGYPPNRLDMKGKTAVHTVVTSLVYVHGDHSAASRCLHVLADHGADLNLLDKEGKAPLHYASIRWIDDMKVLLQLGVDANVRTATGRTALHGVCSRLSQPTGIGECRIWLLLEHGADINAEDNLGVTPFHCLLPRGPIRVLEAFRDQGADVLKADRKGRNALHMICRTGCLPWDCVPRYRDIVEFLIGAGCSIEDRTDHGWLPIHYATFYGRGDLAGDLVGRGGDIECRNDAGQTPLHLVTCRFAWTMTTLDEEGLFVADALRWGRDVEDVPLALTFHRDGIDHPFSHCLLLDCGANAMAVDNEGNLSFFLAAATGWTSATFDMVRAAAAQGLFESTNRNDPVNDEGNGSKMPIPKE